MTIMLQTNAGHKDLGTAQQLLTSLVGGIIFYFALRSAWRVYFHPLAKFRGPKIAAISDIWYAYHLLSGRAPWAMEAASKKYGMCHVVRIAPNELLFVRPQAFTDIYGVHYKHMELFPKTKINNHGNDEHGGLIWEWDPARHRQVAKQLSPAFSGRSLAAKEPIIHKYVDIFVQRMRLLGSQPGGVSLPMWTDLLSVDISADTAYNREMNALKDSKSPLHTHFRMRENMLTWRLSVRNPPYLDLLAGFSKVMVLIQLSFRFPLTSPLKYPVLFTTMRPHSHIREHSRQQLERRIRRQGAVEYLDFIAQLIPEDREPPRDPKEMRHLEQVAGQLLAAGYEAPAMWFYTTLYYLLDTPATLENLTQEIRAAFQSYNEITATRAAELPYLTACLKESLRMMPNVVAGMPVISPGAMVDGTWIPAGVVCQSCPFAMQRDPKHFCDPLSFRPERWLPTEHPRYDTKYDNDALTDFLPFSQGPRMCSGKDIAWWESRVFFGKLLWTFDLRLVPDQNVDYDRDLKGWGIFEKPTFNIKLDPVLRD